MIATIGLILITILLMLILKTKRPKNFPPGPPSYPIIGNLTQFPRTYLYLKMHNEWKPKYGPLIGLVLGPRKLVGVCGPQEIFQALKHEDLQGRHSNVFIRDRSFNKRLGIIFSHGPFWREQRRFTIRHLRDFGFGKKSMELSIMTEIEDQITEMRTKKIVETSGLFKISTLNVLWQMTANIRYARDDAKVQEVLDDMQLFLRGGALSFTVNFFPFLRTIDPGFLEYTKSMKGVWKMQDFIKKMVKEHQKNFDINSPRDFIDVYLTEIEKEKNIANTSFTEEGLIVTCMDLFLAGTESINSSIVFCLLYMVLYPDVQRKVQKELDAVIGRDKRPTLDDRSRLPYVEAVLSEVLRHNPVSPLTPPHCSVKDTYFNGYFIPEDTIVFISLYSLFNDRGHWGDPENFRPERFLNSRGKYVKDEWLIPFGAGKRICIGEILAKNIQFLFFTSLLQEFCFSTPEGDSKPSTESLPGIVGSPQPFRVLIEKRF